MLALVIALAALGGCLACLALSGAPHRDYLTAGGLLALAFAFLANILRIRDGL